MNPKRFCTEIFLNVRTSYSRIPVIDHMVYEPSKIFESKNHNRIYSDISDARLWNECQVSIVLVSLVRRFGLVLDT